MPAWINPKNTWQVNEIVTANDMNIIADDLLYLKEREARGQVNLSATSTTSSAFVTLATLNLTTRGGDVLVNFYANITHDNGGLAYFDVALDDMRIALDGANGSQVIKPSDTASPRSVSLSLLLMTVSAGAHTLKLQCKTNTPTLSIGVGQFSAVEI